MTDTSRRERVLWILVLSVPPGIGVGGFASVGLGGGTVTLLSAGMGVATTLVIAVLVAGALATGSPTLGTGDE